MRFEECRSSSELALVRRHASPRCGAGRSRRSRAAARRCAPRAARSVPSVLLPARQQLALVAEEHHRQQSASPAAAPSTSSTSCGSRSCGAASTTRQSTGSARSSCSASSPRPGDQHRHVGRAEALDDLLARRRRRASAAAPACAWRATNARRRSIAWSTRSREVSGLAMKPIAPESSARSRASSVDTTHTGMWRVERSAFRRSSTRQPCMSGRKMSSVSTAGWYSRDHGERRRRRCEPTTPLKPFSRAASSRILAKPRSFSTISSTWSPGWMSSRSSPASLANVQPGSAPPATAPRPRRRQRRVGRLPRRRAARALARAATIGLRQVEREHAARARRADQPDLAAEQLGELARDGQAQAGAAVLAAGRAVGLLERLEDDLLLVGRDADAGVAHLEGDHALGCARAPRPRATSPRSPARSRSRRCRRG